MKPLFTFFLSLLTCFSFSQTIHVLTSGNKISLRGLSVVNDNVLWASGSNGTIVRSVNGGKTFEWMTVKGYEGRDFRDVEAFDSNIAVIMAVAEPAIILKTKDGGKSWKKVFEDTTKGMFMDAMDFIQDIGIVIGDPIRGKMFGAISSFQGESWLPVERGKIVSMFEGEAFFAASGTNIKAVFGNGRNPYWFCVSGGIKSRFFSYGEFLPMPFIQGKESTGANSIAINNTNIVIVGGDFANGKDTTSNCILTNDFGKTWIHPQTPPHGYRSCVEFINQNKLITCGTSGVDISNDGGNNWTLISSESFHVCQKAKNGNAVFLAGRDGRIAKLEK